MRILYLIPPIFLLIACKPITPPAPETLVEEVPLPEQKESSIAIPIRIDLRPYLAETEKSLPTTFRGKEENCEGISYSYKFTREPIDFKGIGNELLFEVDGKYLLNLNYCAECTSLFDKAGTCVVPRVYASCGVGEPMRKVTVAYSTSFGISPDFRFKSTTSLRKFETPDACEITLFKYDATAMLRKEVLGVLKKLENDIDKEIASIDIRSSIESAWSSLNEPIDLGGYGFLSLAPKSISLGKVKFENKEASVDLHLSALPTVTSAPPADKDRPLPKLSDHKNTNGYDISLDVIANYDSLSAIMTREISGKSVMIKKNEVIFRSVRIDGAHGKQLNIVVTFDGKKKGVLYLTGTPVFDPATQIISFPDLSFDLQTKNALLRSAKWLFSDKITDLLRSNATFDLNQQLKEMKKMVQEQLNTEITKGVQLKGTVDELLISGIYPSTSNLVIRVSSKGTLKLFM